MNRPILTFGTGTPTARALAALPPTAKIQLPTRVRSRIHVAMATNTNHQSTVTLIVMTAERDVGGEDGLAEGEPVELGDVGRGHRAGDDLVTPRLMPCSMKNVDRVIRKLGIPVRTTR